MLGWWWWLRQLRQPQQQQQQQQINCNNNKKNNIKWPAFRWGVSIKRPNSSWSHPSLRAPASASFPNFAWLKLSPFVSHSAIKQPTSGCRSKIFRWSRLCPMENWTQTHTHTQTKLCTMCIKCCPFFTFCNFFLIYRHHSNMTLVLGATFSCFFLFGIFFFCWSKQFPWCCRISCVCLFVLCPWLPLARCLWLAACCWYFIYADTSTVTRSGKLCIVFISVVTRVVWVTQLHLIAHTHTCTQMCHSYADTQKPQSKTIFN